MNKWTFKQILPEKLISKSKRMQLDPYLKSIAHSTWTIDLNINTTTITLLGESVGVNLCDISSAMVSVKTKVQSATTKMSTLESIKILTLCASKDTILQNEVTYKNKKQFFKSHILAENWC